MGPSKPKHPRRSSPRAGDTRRDRPSVNRDKTDGRPLPSGNLPFTVLRHNETCIAKMLEAVPFEGRQWEDTLRATPAIVTAFVAVGSNALALHDALPSPSSSPASGASGGGSS